MTETPSQTEAEAETPSKPKEIKDPRQGLPPTVEVVQASAPMDLDQTKRSDPKGQYVQYNGIATVRIMGPAEWKEAGVESQDHHEWNYLNHKRVPRSSFSDEQLQYLLRVDGRFSLVTDEPEKPSETTE